MTKNSIKNDILKLSEYVSKKEKTKCEVYFSNIHYTGYRVIIEYGHDVYKFATYKDALAFLSK